MFFFSGFTILISAAKYYKCPYLRFIYQALLGENKARCWWMNIKFLVEMCSVWLHTKIYISQEFVASKSWCLCFALLNKLTISNRVSDAVGRWPMILNF